MRSRFVLAVLMITAAAAPAANAQNPERDSGIRTETQERLAHRNNGFDLNWLGFIGLLGLLGLRPEHAEDSYHPASVE